MDPKEVPTFNKPDSETLEKAAKENLPLVIYFSEEGMDPVEAEREMLGADMAELSQKKAIFIHVPYNGDRTPALDDGSPIPTSKILSANPSRDYGISKYPTVIVADSFGNEVTRIKSTPSAKTLEGKIEEVKDEMEKVEKKLAKNLKSAQESLEKKDVKKFLKYCMSNFKEGVVGLESQTETIRAYRDAIDSAREKIDELLEAGDEKGLKSMAKEYKKTELESEIDEALEIAKG